MVAEKKFHSFLSSTAVKLSVYSSFLDFGLAISVFFLQRKLLPVAMASFLLNLFDTAIAYLTFSIIILFSAAMIIRFKDRIVNVKSSTNEKSTKVYKVVVSLARENPMVKAYNKGVIKGNSGIMPDSVQRVVNKNNQNFIKFNGIWYKVDKDKFDKVARPEY